MGDVLMLLTNAFMPDPRPYEEARALTETGHRVKVLCWDRGEGLPKEERIDGIEVRRIKIRSGHGIGSPQIVFMFLLYLNMIHIMLREKFNIVYCHDFDTIIPGLVIKALKGKKLVFDSHEVYSRMLSRGHPGALSKTILFLEKRLIKLADKVIVTCPAMAKIYASYGVSRVSIIGNWKEPAKFNIAPDIIESKRAELGIRNELVISYIANLGPERIIEPLLRVAETDKSVFLLIGGDGPKRNMIEKAAAKTANIKYLGYVSPRDVPLCTALSDAVYYGYDKNAGMAEFNSPNKLFEALAAGRAFIGGDFGEMGRIIKEEKCGVSLGEFTEESVRAAIAILKDSRQLAEFKSNAKKAGLEKYNWANAKKEYLNALSQL